MTKVQAAWSKLRWSLAQRGLAGTLRFALERAQQTQQAAASAEPLLHPFDLRHGVDTSGLIGGGELRSGHRHDVYNTAYYGMAPSRFHWVLERWVAEWIANSAHPAVAEYSFVDLGCGKGRALLMASQFGFPLGFPPGFHRIIGVELNPGLAHIAQDNLARWKANHSSCPIEVVHQDATEFVFPPGPCLIYLFNPFAAPVVRQLIQRLESQFAARSGELDILYFNPESGSLFETHPGFQLLWSGTMPLSEEDKAADSVASADDLCSVFRWVGTARKRTAPLA